MNTKYLSTYTPAQVSRNMTHEWLHKIGFGHASSYSVSRDYSVPYGIGNIMERLAEKAATYVRYFLTAPTNLALRKYSSSLTVKWGASSSSEGLRSYKVYRQLEGSSAVYLQGTTTSLSFSQAKPTRSATYYVRAEDLEGNTVKSSEVRYFK